MPRAIIASELVKSYALHTNNLNCSFASVQLSPHGREQESSSEAIAAFEGIALFGDVMVRTIVIVDVCSRR